MAHFRICRFMTIHEALRMPRAARYGLVQDLPKPETKDKQEAQRATKAESEWRREAP